MVFLISPLGLVRAVPILLIVHQPFGFNATMIYEITRKDFRREKSPRRARVNVMPRGPCTCYPSAPSLNGKRGCVVR
jgi:hypothetical protein